MNVDTQEIEKNPWERIKDDIQHEVDRSEREIREIELMLEQSQLEIEKLTQRNASLTANLQRVRKDTNELQASNLSSIYDATIDAQQRLFIMRGQAEKLKSERNLIENHIEFLKKNQKAIGKHEWKEENSNASNVSIEQLIQAQEGERLRLSRQMHDGPAQVLSNFILQTEIALRLYHTDQEKAEEELKNLKLAASRTFQKVRDYIFELRPMMLDDLGLIPTLKRYIENFKEQSGLDTDLIITGEEVRFESYLEILVFRSVQGLLNNAFRHSNCNQIVVQLDLEENKLRLSVDDNGKGFERSQMDSTDKHGLKLIRDQVEMIGGLFELDTSTGRGTRVVLHVPIKVSKNDNNP